MNGLVVLCGALICAIGAWGFARPAALLDLASRLKAPGMLWGLAALRLAIGGVLVISASGTRWPGFIQVLGWVAMISGVITPFFGGERLGRVLDWWTARPAGLIRAWSVLALALGGAIVFAGT
jgi:hypothetical protein